MHKKWTKIATISLILLMSSPIIFLQIHNTYNDIIYNSAINSTADINAFNAAVWLNQNYPDLANVVVTRSPGDWFPIFSDKPIISQTYDWEGTNSIADSVLNLDYEIQGPQTLVKAFETNRYLIDECYVYLNQAWTRVSSSSLDADFISFTQNGVNYSFALSDLSRTTSFYDQSNPKEIEFSYFNNQVALTQTILVQNDSYPIDVSWSISPLNGGFSNVTLYLTTYFDLQFNFNEAQIPQLMNWVNPWDMPSKATNGKEWAFVNFTSSNMVNHYLGLLDQQKQTAFTFNFNDLPAWVSIGALANRQIDAVRYQYDFNQIGTNQSVIRHYQVLTLTKDSYATLQPDEIQSLFNYKFTQFPLLIRNYKDYIAENNIGFIVYDKNQIDDHTYLPLGVSFLPQLARCQFLEMVYSNSRYDIFKILSNYTQTQIWK